MMEKQNQKSSLVYFGSFCTLLFFILLFIFTTNLIDMYRSRSRSKQPDPVVLDIRITNEDAQLMTYPNETTKQIAVLPIGTTVEVTEQLNDWIKIRTINSSGYILKDKTIEKNINRIKIRENTVLYKRPGGELRSEIISAGSITELLDVNGEWSKIKYKHILGWIKNSDYDPVNND